MYFVPKTILDKKEFPSEGINPRRNIGLVLECGINGKGFKKNQRYKIVGGNEMVFVVVLVDRDMNVVDGKQKNCPNYFLHPIEEKQPKLFFKS